MLWTNLKELQTVPMHNRNSKIVFKTENNHLSMLIAASFKDYNCSNVKLEQKENTEAKEQV